GLGIKFLRHIERTRILFHLVCAESAHPVKDYKTIKRELATYSKELAQKFEYVFLSKSDLVPPKDLKKKLAALKKMNPRILVISIHDWDSMEKVKKILAKIQDKK
ncbi:MAG: GTPase ObgE, partial [Candidatus Sungiibacteriota bacterium]